MLGLFSLLGYVKPADLESARAVAKTYEQKARTAKANMDYNRTLAEQLTDEGRLDEAKRYWNQVAKAKKQFELYERKRRAWEVASQKIGNELMDTQYNTKKLERIAKRALKRIKKKKAKIGERDDGIEAVLNDVESAEEVHTYSRDYIIDAQLTTEGEQLMQEYLKKKQARESQIQTQESELERQLQQLQGAVA